MEEISKKVISSFISAKFCKIFEVVDFHTIQKPCIYFTIFASYEAEFVGHEKLQKSVKGITRYEESHLCNLIRNDRLFLPHELFHLLNKFIVADQLLPDISEMVLFLLPPYFDTEQLSFSIHLRAHYIYILPPYRSTKNQSEIPTIPFSENLITILKIQFGDITNSLINVKKQTFFEKNQFNPRSCATPRKRS